LFIFFVFSAWLNDCQSAILYEQHVGKEIFYVLPVEDILGKAPVVPVGPTGTIPFSMRGHALAQDFVDVAFDSSEGAGDGSRWWYINSWALGWSREA
jgi:hypothetical protein